MKGKEAGNVKKNRIYSKSMEGRVRETKKTNDKLKTVENFVLQSPDTNGINERRRVNICDLNYCA